MGTLVNAFLQHWKTLAVSRERPVLLALSGGLDSMTLATLLLECGIPFAVAHCNFGLRVPDSNLDEAFVSDWAATNNIRVHIAQMDVADREPGESVQMWARRRRYEWFGELLKTFRYAALLTAHHANDVAETMLINLVRGSGLSGLQGIPAQNGAILRPLLFATRAELADYAAERQLRWREDLSNASEKYLRNAIRMRVIPVLEELHPGATSRMAATGGRIAGSLPIYRSALQPIMKNLIETRGRDRYVPIRLLQKQPQLDTIIYELFNEFGFGGDRVPAIRALMDAESGRQLHSETHRILRDRDFLIVTGLRTEDADIISVDEGASVIVTQHGEIHIRKIGMPATIPDSPELALLDARKISFPLTLRARRDGDYFYPLGMGGKKKKLKRYLNDIRMPAPDRERQLILEQAGKVIWVVGSRIDERFKLRPDTTEVLEIRLVRVPS